MNLNQTFSILFWLNRSKANSKGLVPIWARITVGGKRAECSIKKQILPGLWDLENNKAKGNSDEAKAINNYLIIVQAELIKHYNILLSTKEMVTAEDVKNSYKGIKEEKKTFLQLFTLYNQKLSERKEIEDLSEGRYNRFKIPKNKCGEFIKDTFKKSDVALDEVKLNFIVEFEHYLRIVKKIGYNTAMKYMKDLK